MNSYLIKRDPGLSDKGVIPKRKENNKSLFETAIKKNSPVSSKLLLGDIIYIAETKYGIYAKGMVSTIFDIVEIKSMDEAIKFYKKYKTIDANYWMTKIIDFDKAIGQNSNAILKFQEYQINQKLLSRTIPLIGPLDKAKFWQGMVLLDEEKTNYIENPLYEEEHELKAEIPSSLKMDIYSLFNQKLRITHWIDIDHFVPKSAGGPGNIIENLVPIGLGLNRYKSNSIPRGLFEVANKDYPNLKKFCLNSFLSSKNNFLRRTSFPDALDKAQKMNQYIRKNFTINECKIFYKKVMAMHFPEYVKIIESF